MILAAVAASLLMGRAALAQDQASADTKARYQALLQKTIRHPKDLDAAFAYAQMATRLGDYEAAIGAYDRMLFYNPHLPRVRLELGALYYRLGSFTLAKSYFDEVLAEPGTPPAVRKNIETYLAAMQSGGTPAGKEWSVYAQTGLRWQSNAGLGPDSDLVYALGGNAVLAKPFRRRPDWNWFALSTVTWAHPIAGGAATIEASLVGYYSKQFRIDRLDLGFLELQIGPRFALPGIKGGSVKVYGIGNVASLADAPFLATAGVGVLADLPLGTTMAVEPFLEYRNRNFNNSTTYQTAAQLTGNLVTAGFIVGGPLAPVPGLSWAARLAYEANRVDSRFTFNSYDRFALDLLVPYAFTRSWGGEAHQIVVTPQAGFSYAAYQRPDPIINPTITRVDNEWRIGLGVDVQLWKHVGVSTLVQYDAVQSSLRNFTAHDFSVTFGPTLRF
ncbi:MAG TPA: tetratricopeptide repeat protein [Hyphomicrobiales bacterium]|nr:tetratricopeptide repeat protein [Hyphomicrobiales bacterium]